MSGQWYNTTTPQVVLQVQLANSSNVPLTVDEVRGDFKRGTRDGAPTLFTDRRKGVVIPPGQSRRVYLGWENPRRYDPVSVDLAIAYHGPDGMPRVHRGFVKGNLELRYYERLDRGINGITPTPDALGSWPITTGPLYPWPSIYDVKQQPDNNGIIHFGI
jgi:hypothetical protein